MNENKQGRPVKPVKFVFFPRAVGTCPIPSGKKGSNPDSVQPVNCDERFDEIFSVSENQWTALQGTRYENWLVVCATLETAENKLKECKKKLYPHKNLFKHTKGK